MVTSQSDICLSFKKNCLSFTNNKSVTPWTISVLHTGCFLWNLTFVHWPPSILLLRCLKIGLPFVRETTHVTLFLKLSINFSNWISITSRADMCTVTTQENAQSGWRILPFATTVCGIYIDALGYLSPYHCNDLLSTGRHFLGISFIINPKKDLCTTLIMQITRGNNCIISHAQNTPAFQPNHILTRIYWLLFTNKKP